MLMEFASNIFTVQTIYLQEPYIYRMRTDFISQCPFESLKQQFHPLHSCLFEAPCVTERWLCIVATDLAFVSYTYKHVHLGIEEVKFSSQWCLLYKASVSSGFAKLVMPYLVQLTTDMYLMCVSLAADRFKPRLVLRLGLLQTHRHQLPHWILILDYVDPSTKTSKPFRIHG